MGDKDKKPKDKKPEVKASDYVVIPSNVWTAIADYVTNQPWKEVDQLISPVKSVPTLAKFMESVEVK